MTKITTDFTGSETIAVAHARQLEIARAYGLDEVTTSASGWRSFVNTLLDGTSTAAIGATELAGTFLPKLNLLNDPSALLAAAVGAPNAFVIDPDTVFSDVAGTVPASYGEGVAALRGTDGEIFATQGTASQRPTYGRHPAGGIRNILAANTADLTDGEGWGYLRTSAADAPESATGEPATTLSATETSGNGAGLIIPSGLALAAGDYTFSAVCKSTGWVALRVSDDGDFADRAEAWFNLGAGTAGTVRANPGTGKFTAASSTITAEGDGYRVTLTFTLASAITTSPRIYVVDGNTNLSVTNGASARVEAPQLEAGDTATAYQRRVSQYDVTEAGVRDVYYFDGDLVDDWFGLATAFAPDGPYTILAVREGLTGFPAPMNFGSTTNNSFVTGAHTINVTADTSSNRVLFDVSNDPTWPALTGVPRVDVVRVNTATTAQAWRNGQEYAGTPTVTGNLYPVDGINALLRSGGGYGGGRFYGGALVPSAITDAARVAAERALAWHAGVTL